MSEINVPAELDDLSRPVHPVLEAALRQPGMVSTAAAREMINSVQRRRKAAEVRTEHRVRWLVTSLGLFIVAGSTLAAVTPNSTAAAILWPLTSLATGTAVGLVLRGRL